MMQCIQAQLVVFSGIKIDKLDDLEAMIAAQDHAHSECGLAGDGPEEGGGAA